MMAHALMANVQHGLPRSTLLAHNNYYTDIVHINVMQIVYVRYLVNLKIY